MPVKQVLMLLVCDLLFIDILIKRVVFGSDGWHIYLQYKHTHTHARNKSSVSRSTPLARNMDAMSDRKRIVFKAFNL